MKIYGDSISGNCLKVKYTADFLELPYTWIEINILEGESRTPEYLAINPHGQVPAIVLDDGTCLAQSNAIIRYLAAGSALLPADHLAAARIDEWLLWEQYSHEPYIAVLRFQMLYLGKPASEREAARVERGEAALDAMETHLAAHKWFANEQFSIADISLLAYTRLAAEGGFSLATRPALRRWISEAETLLGIAA